MALPIANKIYKFKNFGASSRYLNLYSTGSATDGMNVCLWTGDGSNEQKWKYDGSFLRPSTNTNFALDKYTVSGNANNNNADIWTANDATNQQITFVSVSGDTVRIKLKNSSLYLTASSNANGTSGGKSPTSAGNVYWAALNSSNNLQKWTFEEVGGGSSGVGQKLIFPFDKQYYTVGYKSDAPAYELKFGYGAHYANDMYASGGTTVKASGKGKIVDLDTFKSLGNILAVQYDNVLDKTGKNIGSIIMRYCHLASYLKTSGTVEKGDPIAVEGGSGEGAQNGLVIHLHLEADTDINFPMATPTENGGVDTTIDPLSFLYRSSNQTVQPDSDDGQSSTDSNGKAWYNIGKIRNIPIV